MSAFYGFFRERTLSSRERKQKENNRQWYVLKIVQLLLLYRGVFVRTLYKDESNKPLISHQKNVKQKKYENTQKAQYFAKKTT